MRDVLAVWLVFTLVSCASVAYFDIRFRRIPNGLLVSMLLACTVFFLYAGGMDGPESGLKIHWLSALTGFVAGLAFFYPFWRLGVMGAGDVKLIAVLGFMFGLHGLWQLVVIGSVLAGLHACVLLLSNGRAVLGRWREGKGSRRGVPFGAHLALATLLWVFWPKGALLGL